jgi:hypothetical protein
LLRSDRTGGDRLADAPMNGTSPPPFDWEAAGDNAAVDQLAAAMKAKLARKRTEGRGGWRECSEGELWRWLREHVEKGDPVDIANFAMMIHGVRQAPRKNPKMRFVR